MCRRGKGRPTEDPFVTTMIDSKGKAKAKEDDVTNQELVVEKRADGELEDEDEIVEDDAFALSDWQGSGVDDDGKPFVYQEDLHKRR
jgi:hypothetical protein